MPDRPTPDGAHALLLARDPRHLVAAWSVSPGTRIRVLRELRGGAEDATSALRLLRGGAPAVVLDVPAGAEHWVFADAEPGGTYALEVGIRTGGEGFVALARSAAVTTPSEAPAPDGEVRWVRTSEPTTPTTRAWTGRRVQGPVPVRAGSSEQRLRRPGRTASGAAEPD